MIDFGCAGAGDGGGYRHGRGSCISVVLLLGELGVDGAQGSSSTPARRHGILPLFFWPA